MSVTLRLDPLTDTVIRDERKALMRAASKLLAKHNISEAGLEKTPEWKRNSKAKQKHRKKIAKLRNANQWNITK